MTLLAPLLATLLAEPCASANAAVASSAVAVATPAELAAAITAGAAHVVVTVPLDLSRLPASDWLGEPAASGDFGRDLFVDARLQSLRARHAAHSWCIAHGCDPDCRRGRVCGSRSSPRGPLPALQHNVILKVPFCTTSAVPCKVTRAMSLLL